MEMIFDVYPTEFLIEKGYVSFAEWSDWGLLCFDTNRNNKITITLLYYGITR